MTINYHKLLYLFYSSLAFALSLITALLLYEYYALKIEASQLVQLKEEYRNTIALLKKGTYKVREKKNDIDDATCADDDSCVESDDTFLVVNRDPEYLKRSALAFAKEQNLEWALSKLYESNDWLLSIDIKKKSHQKLRAKGKQKIAASENKRIQTEEYTKKNEKPLFMWPVEKSQLWLSSPFGPRKKSNGAWGFHYGLDMAAVKGTLVKAAASGVVVKAGWSDAYGNMVEIVHNRKYRTRYAHLSALLVSVGQKVKRGDSIGKVGNTGNVRSKRGGDGTHLHFEIYVFGKRVNPIYFLP